MSTTNTPDLRTVMPPEILNRIFENVVIFRDPRTGQQKPIRMPSFVLLARRLLRASKTCKKFREIMLPMFFGQNIFELQPITEILTELASQGKELAQDPLDAFTVGSGLEAIRYAYDHCYYKPWLENRQAILLPPAVHRHLLKNVTLIIELPGYVQEGRMNDEKREKLASEGAPWLSVVRTLRSLGLKNLDVLTIKVKLPSKESGGLHPGYQKKYDLAKEGVKQFINASAAFIPAKKVEVQLPESW